MGLSLGDVMKYLIPDWLYDILKWAVTALLPAFTALFVALAATWHWPMADQIKDTLIALYTFFGAIMGISGGVAMMTKE